jgi:glycosyltransferase involved in cell wall biosynthesis
MNDITAIILTKNEEKDIGDCLKSISGLVRRAVVVDCGSTDDTVEIAKSLGAEVFTNAFSYYAQQFNWGIDNTGIDTGWIIRIDADERFSAELCEEIHRQTEAHAQGDVTGLAMDAQIIFMGRKLRHAGKKRKVMVFKTGVGRIEDRRRDAHTVVSRGRVLPLKNPYTHYDYKGLDHYIKRYNWYADREALDYLDYQNGKSQAINTDAAIAAKRRRKFNLYYRFPPYFRAWLWFFYNYVIRLGFLDGGPGFVYCFLECYWYRVMVDAKLMEYERTGKIVRKLTALAD